MTLRFWANPHLQAELDGELDGWKYTMRFSSHYFWQEDLSCHWGHYQTQFYGIQKCVDDEVPASTLKAIQRRASLTEIQLMKDYPPSGLTSERIKEILADHGEGDERE